MKTIGIIAAMDEEITSIRDKIDVKVTKSAVGVDFYIGNLHGKSIVAVKCGIGKVNAAVCTQALIDLFAVDCVINTGVAGGVFREINIGDLVISKDAVQHDMDCSVFGDKIGVIPRMEDSVFKADEKLVELAKQAAAELGYQNDRKIYVQRVASGDQFISSKEKKKEIWDNVGGYCAEMEGAAIAHACYLNKIPFVIVRAISDNADNSGDVDFNAFMITAAETSSALADKIIELL